jgi:hypothetical protein|tara:strand:+ start:1286 stop:1762 length:477 start_codon:yes stop_codon:yes gene_type:complete
MGKNIMKIDDITTRRLIEKDIHKVFEIAKISLFEKGITNIKDDILITTLKQSLVRKFENFDFGLFKMNTLIGYTFTTIGQLAYEDKGFARVDNIYLLPEFRTEANYVKLLKALVNQMDAIGIKDIKTSDSWTLCNDCEVFSRTIEYLGKPNTIYRILT